MYKGNASLTTRKNHSHQNFTINSDGTISLDLDPDYVLAALYDNQIGWTQKTDEVNKLIFEGAQELLGVSSTHGLKEQEFLNRRQSENK